MLSFLLFSAFAVAGVAIAGIFSLPFLLLAGVIWLILLPIKLLFGGLFRLVFGLFGALLALVVTPIVMLLAGVALVGGLIAGIVALLAPLVPVILLLLLGWAVYRVVIRPTTA